MPTKLLIVESPGKVKNHLEHPKPTLTHVLCPLCQQLLEQYSYQKDGQSKVLLRCSNPKARSDKKHKDVVYSQTEKGWWSPKLGELPVVKP